MEKRDSTLVERMFSSSFCFIARILSSCFAAFSRPVQELSGEEKKIFLLLKASAVVCRAEVKKLEEEEETAADIRSLLEKVKQLTKEVETLKKKAAGKSSGELEDLARGLQGLSSDLSVLMALTPDILEKIFGYLDPASVKAVSLVSR